MGRQLDARRRSLGDLGARRVLPRGIRVLARRRERLDGPNGRLLDVGRTRRATRHRVARRSRYPLGHASRGDATPNDSSSSIASASAVAGRSSAFRATARSTMASSCGDTSGATLLGALTTSLNTFEMRLPWFSARNKSSPVNASQRTTPAEYTSLRAVVSSSMICSGAMYASFPFTSPGLVVRTRSSALATPKSSTRATPSMPTMMLCGETSRWTIPSGSPRSSFASCAACNPRSAPATIAAAILGGIRSARATARSQSSASDAPATYSMTRMSSPSSATTSSVGTTFGWCTCAASRASSRNASTKRCVFANCG